MMGPIFQTDEPSETPVPPRKSRRGELSPLESELIELLEGHLTGVRRLGYAITALAAAVVLILLYGLFEIRGVDSAKIADAVTQTQGVEVPDAR